MLSFILRMLFAFFVVRTAMGLARLVRRPAAGGRSRHFAPGSGEKGASSPDYRDLTPYDIEDADYEELPGDDA